MKGRPVWSYRKYNLANLGESWVPEVNDLDKDLTLLDRPALKVLEGEGAQDASNLALALAFRPEPNQFAELPPTEMRDVIIAQWDAVVTNTVVVHEGFMRAAGQAGWCLSEARRRLSPTGLATAQARDSVAGADSGGIAENATSE